MMRPLINTTTLAVVPRNLPGPYISLGREEGFTLAESLVAVAILGIAAVTLVVALSTGSISVREADQQATARGLATAQMEYIKGLPYDVSGAYPTLSAPAGYSLSVSADSGIYADADIQKVTVTVNRGTSQVTELEGYKVNR